MTTPRWRTSVGSRPLLVAAIAWITSYLAVYLALLDRQGGASPAWWYVALLAVVVLGLSLALVGVLGHRSLVALAVLLGLAALVAVLSIGALLVPAVAAVAVAAAKPPEAGAPT